MQEYYFLFAIVAIWSVVAAVQDVRRSEVSNWLNYSLLAIVLAYRAFYAVFNSDVMFFVYGILGFFIFFILGYVFYYTRAFGGGDVKLLYGIGAALPFGSLSDVLSVSFVFVFVLLFIGVLYSLGYSAFLLRSRWKGFRESFSSHWKRHRFAAVLSILVGIAILVFSLYYRVGMIGGFMFLILVVFPILFIYIKAVDDNMTRVVNWRNLQEGDWLEKGVKLGKRVIKKSVYGLDLEEIALLRKAKKNVLIKQGVKFVPAILLTWIIMVFFYLILQLRTLSEFLSFLS